MHRRPRDCCIPGAGTRAKNDDLENIDYPGQMAPPPGDLNSTESPQGCSRKYNLGKHANGQLNCLYSGELSDSAWEAGGGGEVFGPSGSLTGRGESGLLSIIVFNN
jgi:hypothetical protein